MSTQTLHKAKVAIKCLVYNHEPYLRDCLEGFVMQQTDFPFVAIIHDDASTDHSADIIREYAAKYPDIIHPIYETENQWSRKDGSLTKIMNAAVTATGAPYIAMCEGDDYWTDPHKLQKQVDFMDGYPEIGLCYTDYNRLEEATHQLTLSMFEKQQNYRPTTYEQNLLQPSYLAPMTWLYRVEFISLFKARIYSDGTYSYMLEFMHNSKVAYLPIVTATYRSHIGSASFPKDGEATFRFTKGVFDTQVYYAEKYFCSNELKNKILLRGYLDIIPTAVIVGNESFILEAKEYMQLHGLNIDLIIRELEAGKVTRQSRAYRLGKMILKPLNCLKRWI